MSVRVLFAKLLVLPGFLTGLLFSAPLSASSPDYLIEFADINNDGLEEIRLTPRNMISQLFLRTQDAGILHAPLSMPSAYKTLVLERYCIEQYELDVQEPCEGFCASSLMADASSREPYEYGVHWDYRLCPVTGQSNWRFVIPMTQEELAEYPWGPGSREYELLAGEFTGDGNRDLIIRALVPDRSSIRIDHSSFLDLLAGNRQIRNTCERRNGVLRCKYYCASDGSGCMGDQLKAYYILNNTGVWFGNDGIELQILDVNSDGIDDIRVYQNGYRLHDYIHLKASNGSYAVLPSAIDTDLVKMKWDGFINALSSGNAASVYQYSSSAFRLKYQELLESGEFSELAANWSEPVLIDLNDQTAVYAVRQNEGGQEFVYTIVLSWDAERGWLIHDM